MGLDSFVKNCEGSEVLPYLKAYKLSCHRFMDVGRRHETRGSETRALFLTEIVVVRTSTFSGSGSPTPKSHRVTERGPSYIMGCTTGEEPRA